MFSYAEVTGVADNRPGLRAVLDRLSPALRVWTVAQGTYGLLGLLEDLLKNALLKGALDETLAEMERVRIDCGIEVAPVETPTDEAPSRAEQAPKAATVTR